MLRSKTKSIFIFWTITFFLLLLFLLLQHFIFAFTPIQGSSMFPTIKNGDQIILDQLRYHFQDPEYHDIVIFNNNGRYYIKRVIGKGGDSVRVQDGTVYRNDQPLQEDYVTTGQYPDFPEVTVPQGKYFVLGDNRRNSVDSRDEDLGFIDREQIIGKAIFRYWPLESFGRI